MALRYNVRLLASQDVCIHVISFRHDVQLPVPQDICIHIMSKTLRLSIYVAASRATVRSRLQGNRLVVAQSCGAPVRFRCLYSAIRAHNLLESSVTGSI
jgi:hypothetical protein